VNDRNNAGRLAFAWSSRGSPGARALRWLAGFALAAALAACGGGGSSGASEDLVALAQRTDKASCSYAHLYITVERVRVLQHAGGGERWIDLAPTAPRQIDLLNASGGLLRALGIAPLAAGHYTELRLILVSSKPDGGTSNAVQPTGAAGLSPLTVPSGAQSGLKLHGDFLVPSGQAGDVVLQGFDPCEAVVQVGKPTSPRYQLKPEMAASVQLAQIEIPIALGMVMPLLGGGFVVSRQPQPNAWVLQRYGADGQPVGAETTVAPAMGQDAWAAGIAPLAGGGYAAVWMELVEFQRFGGSIYNLLEQSFTATGAPIGSPLQIAQTIPGLYWYPRPPAMPQVAALAGGGYVLVWGQSNGTGLGVYARRFNADGTPAGAAQQVAPVGNGYLGVVGLSTGGYLVTWGTVGVPDGGARAYGPDDAPLGTAQPAGPAWSDFPVNGGAAPVIAPLAGGGAVIVWLRDTFPYVRVQQLAPDGTPLASARIVDDSTSLAPTHNAPAVAGLPGGGYVVAWIETGEVHARRFAANGTPAGAETRVNLVTTSVQPPIAVAAMAGGSFTISWNGVGADGTNKNYARVFPANGLLD
jgi:hypothetical protein